MANDRPPNADPASKDPGPRPSLSVSHLALAALEAKVPKDQVYTFKRGDVIKHAGTQENTLLVVSSGSVSVQRDVKTADGTRSVTTDVFHKGDPLNYGWDFAKTSADEANRYVADNDDTRVIVLTVDIFDDKHGRLRELAKKKFLAAITRHGANLRDELTRVIADKFEVERYARELEETMTAKQQAFDQDIERLKQRAAAPAPSELDALEIGDSLQIAQLKAQVTDLLQKLGDERMRNERYKGMIAQLRPIAEQKGHEATATLEEDERIAKGIVNLSNYFFSLVSRELTTREVDEVRRLIRDVHTQWSDEHMATLIDTAAIVRDITEADNVERISSLRPEPPPLPPTHSLAPTRREGGPPPLPFSPKVTPAPSEAVKPDSEEKPAWRKSSPGAGEYSFIEPEEHPPTQRAHVWPSDGPDIEAAEVSPRRTLDWRELNQSIEEEPPSRDTLLGGMTSDKK